MSDTSQITKIISTISNVMKAVDTVAKVAVPAEPSMPKVIDSIGVNFVSSVHIDNNLKSFEEALHFFEAFKKACTEAYPNIVFSKFPSFSTVEDVDNDTSTVTRYTVDVQIWGTALTALDVVKMMDTLHVIPGIDLSYFSLTEQATIMNLQ